MFIYYVTVFRLFVFMHAARQRLERNVRGKQHYVYILVNVHMHKYW